MIFGIDTTCDISKLSQISLAYWLVKLRITTSKYHSWYLCQISRTIMLLPILIISEHKFVRPCFFFAYTETHLKVSNHNSIFASFSAVHTKDKAIKKRISGSMCQYQAILDVLFSIFRAVACFYRRSGVMHEQQ